MTNKNTNSGIGLTTILFVVFLVLKLTETITWSWWWVTAPLWIPAIVGLSVFMTGFFFLMIRELHKMRQ